MVNQFLKVLTILFVFIVVSNEVNSQTKSGSIGNLYIPEKGSISVFGIHHFGYGGYLLQPGLINTCRSMNVNKGILYFAEGSSWSGADELKHIDGYVGNFSNTEFVFPIGNDGIYSPITTGPNSQGVVAAFYNKNPQEVSGNIQNVDIESIASKGYWDIDGEYASSLSLTWNPQSSNGLGMEGSLNTKSILGWNGSEWVIIPSIVENNITLDNSKPELLDIESDNKSGVITTLNSIVPNDFELFTIGIINDDLAEFVNNDNVGSMAFEIFPNPASSLDEIKIAYKFENDTVKDGFIEVYDLSGALLYKRSTTFDSVGIIDLDTDIDTKNGEYMISVKTSTERKVEEIIIVD